MPISLDPDINNGKPTVSGTRISVQTILGHLSAGDSIQDVLACLEYGAKMSGHSITFEKIA